MSEVTSEPGAKGAGGFKKVMRGLDMTLFTVCAILVIDQLAASAAIGAQSVFWWIFTMILFFIPYGLITAELGSTYPDEGGIYAWVRRAFGPRWGGRTAWLWWINVALWQPSVFILFAGIFATLFIPDLPLWWQIAIAVLLTWIVAWINIIALDVGKWVPNIGALFKVVIMLTIGIGGFVYAGVHGVANDLSFSSMAPSWGTTLAFLPVIVYNFMGFELMSGASEEMTDPAKDVPRAIVVSGLLIAAFYLLGTVGILIALPLEEVSLIEGIIDTLYQLLGTEGLGGAAVMLLGVMALYTFLANMVTWTMGANRSAAEAAHAGDLNPAFAKLHPVHKTPANAAIIAAARESRLAEVEASMHISLRLRPTAPQHSRQAGRAAAAEPRRRFRIRPVGWPRARAARPASRTRQGQPRLLASTARGGRAVRPRPTPDPH